MRWSFSGATALALQACAGLALVIGTTFLMAATCTAAAQAPAMEVSITHFAFAPKELTVAPGTRVVWTNHDEAPHTVTGHDKAFASKGLDTDDRYEHVFTEEGDFDYLCTVHPFMTGVVHVRRR
jgi:plastocyanin